MLTGLHRAIQWRAPEVSENFFHAAGDVFSFGVTVWELLTRKKPFDGLDAYEVLRQVRDGKRPPIPESDATGLQADLIQRCWAQDPAARPSFQHVLEYLKPLSTSPLFIWLRLWRLSDFVLLQSTTTSM